MHIACLHGNIGLVQGLLKHSKSVQPLDFSLRTRDGLSAWQIAMDNHHYEIAQLVANEAVQVPTAASHRPILS
jgi:ankyrin repeat protein